MSDQLLYAKADIFNACMKDLHNKLGSSVSQKQVVDSEVIKIIEKTIKNTKHATLKSIQKSIDRRPPYRTYNGKIYKITNRFPDSVWNFISGRLNESMERKISAMSLARKTWYELGIKIGPIKAPVETKVAHSKVDPAGNVAITREEVNGNYGLTIENNSPLIRCSGSSQALFSAIAGRTNFFKQNLRRGVFDSMESVVKKYPGIKFNK